jgi:hypothetical protein
MTTYRNNDETHLTTIHQAGGREIEVFIVDDHDPDLSWLGEMVDKPAATAAAESTSRASTSATTATTNTSARTSAARRARSMTC